VTQKEFGRAVEFVRESGAFAIVPLVAREISCGSIAHEAAEHSDSSGDDTIYAYNQSRSSPNATPIPNGISKWIGGRLPLVPFRNRPVVW
jgi:hypothetical protein